MADTQPVISIVDDDPSVRRAHSRLVRLAGYIVESFASAREFLASAPRGRPACLVRTRERLKQSGVAGILSKPFGDQALLNLIRRATCPA